MDRPRIVVIRPLQQRELAIRTLLRSEVEVIILDEPNSPLASMGDHLIPVESIRDYAAVEEALVSFHATRPISGIVTFLDYLLPAVGKVNERLGLRGLTEAVAERCFNKRLQRAAFEKRGVPGPEVRQVTDIASLRRAVDELGYPFVLKPVDRTGSRGVSLVEGPDELMDAFTFATEEGWGGGLIAEAYLDGMEHGVDVVTQNGTSKAFAVSDKTFLPGRFFIRDAHWMPSRLAASDQEAMCSIAVHAVEALGIMDNVSHVQLRLTKSGPRVVEVNGRVNGGFNSDLLLKATGINLYAVMLDVLLGRPARIEPLHARFAALREIVTGAGKIERLELGSIPLSNANLVTLQSYIKPGQVLTPITHGNDARGVVVAHADDIETIDREIERLLSSIHIVTSSV